MIIKNFYKFFCLFVHIISIVCYLDGLVGRKRWIVFFAFTATRINKISKIGKLARENVAIRRKTFIIYTKLFLIMGLTWIFGFIAAYAKNSFLWSLFIVFNSLQGFYILIAFTDIKWGNLRNLINCPLHRKTTSSSSIATATTISTEQ